MWLKYLKYFQISCWFLARLTFEYCKLSYVCYLLHAGFLLGLFDPEDGGDMFLHYIPENRMFHNHCCENLRSYSVGSLFYPVIKHYKIHPIVYNTF
jgi:hypothetical protein